MNTIASPDVLTRDRTPTPWIRHLCHFTFLILITGTSFVLALPAIPSVGFPQALYALAVALNVWPIAMTAWGSVLGLAVVLWRRSGGETGGPLLLPPTGRARTAVIMPVYEEDPVRVFAAADTIAQSVSGLQIGEVDVFVLSDSRSIAGAAHEEKIAGRLAAVRPSRAPHVFYRRRADNRGRKAGNIAEWFARWGAAYDFVVVLDADSLMTGPAVARLVGAMEANPNAGLIQAMCYPVGRSTLFARIQQFSARLYGPVFQRGVAFWQGPRGNYWGHNAIVRTTAFAAHCGLPLLPGRAPFGGEIMSHDTVEAALMLRGGWDVWMLPDGPEGRHDGSWEETPTNLLDHLDRDRRWCLGNLQHLAVLRARGLHLASVYHLTRGLLHYLYVMPFLAWLVLYAAVDRPGAAGAEASLVALVLTLIILPRLVCLGAALAEDAPGFGGTAALVASACLDQAVAWLIYPAAVVFHTIFILGAVSGRATHWKAQFRDDRDLTWRAAARMLVAPLAGGLAALALLSWTAPVLAAVFAPGLLLAIPLAVWSSRFPVGTWARRHGLFAVPDETRLPTAWRTLKCAEAALSSATVEADLPALPPENGLPLTVQVLRA